MGALSEVLILDPVDAAAVQDAPGRGGARGRVPSVGRFQSVGSRRGAGDNRQPVLSVFAGREPAQAETPSSKTFGESADADGLARAFETHGGELLGFARRALGNTWSAEEAVQETFTRAWRSRRRFDPDRGTLRGWLFAIERNIILDFGRARASNRVTVVKDVEQAANSERSVEDPTAGLVLTWQVEDALRALSPEHRRVVEEVCLRGRTGPEAAAVLSIPEGTVRSRLHYALRLLRESLQDTGWIE